MNKFTISLFFSVTLLLADVKSGEVCISDDMDDATSSLLTKECPEPYYNPFDFYNYGYINNPLGSDWYMGNTNGEVNCGISEFLNANKGIDIVVHYYTFKNGTRDVFCNLNFIGEASGGLRLTIDDSRVWKNATLHVDRSTNMQFKLDCSFSTWTEFIAIGNIWFLTDDLADCPQRSSSPIPTTETTTVEITTEEPTSTEQTTLVVELTTTEAQPEISPFEGVPCRTDNLATGESKLLNQGCSRPYHVPFNYRTYSDNFTNDLGSNYFMTAGISEMNCARSDKIPVKAGNKVVIQVYTSNTGNRSPTCYLSYSGATSTLVDINIDNSQRWRSIFMDIPSDDSVDLMIECFSLSSSEFLAIGNIWVTAETEEQCPHVMEGAICVNDDMSGGRSMLLSSCLQPGRRLFNFERYGELLNPLGSDFYMVSGNNEMNCGLSETISLKAGNKVAMRIYTTNNSTTTATCYVDVFGDIRTYFEIDVDNSRTWRTVSVEVKEDADVQIRLECIYLRDQVLAVGNIWIVSDKEEDCPEVLNPTTTEAPTTIPEDVTCYTDLMGGGSSSFLRNRCPRSYFRDFQFLTYNGSLPNPFGSEYYMTTTGEINCLMSDIIMAQVGNVLEVEYYTSNKGSQILECYVDYNGDSVGDATIFVDDAQAWRKLTLNVGRTGNIQTTIHCDVMGDDQFFAVGKITIKAENQDECPVITDLTTTTIASTTCHCTC